MRKIKEFVLKNWLLCLICAQPFLDVLAFWTRSESGTAAGYIRLGIMCVLCLYVLFHVRGYVRFVPSAVLVALVFGLHMVNCFRKGYLGFASDTRMILTMAYLPVLAVCFCCLISEDGLKNQAVKGIMINFWVESLIVLLSYVTGTYMHTYTEGFGIAGWVISDNRCCHSDVISSVSVFAAYFASVSKKKWINVAVPLVIFVLLITNGTTVCYFSLLAICAGYPAFLAVSALIGKRKQDASQRLVSVVMLVLLFCSLILYPVTPRYKMEELKRRNQDKREELFAAEMDALGYNVYNVSLDEIFSDELLHEKFVDYYKLFIFGSVEPLGRNYSFDRIIRAYNGTVNSNVIGDIRDMKTVYVRFLFEDSDVLTKLFGIEYDQIGPDKTNDLENDWFAILYYLGWFGFAASIAGVLYIFLRIFRFLKKDFQGSLTETNFTLLLCFVLQLGMGYFSGAVMRRPNASIYVALAIAMIFYNTGRKTAEKSAADCA